MSNTLPQESEFLLYSTPQGDVRLQILVLDETVWLTQEGMQALFGKVKSTVSEHISNVFEDGELERKSVVRKFRTTVQHGAIASKMQTKMGIQIWELSSTLNKMNTIITIKASIKIEYYLC